MTAWGNGHLSFTGVCRQFRVVVRNELWCCVTVVNRLSLSEFCLRRSPLSSRLNFTLRWASPGLCGRAAASDGGFLSSVSVVNLFCSSSSTDTLWSFYFPLHRALFPSCWGLWPDVSPRTLLARFIEVWSALRILNWWEFVGTQTPAAREKSALSLAATVSLIWD